MLCRGYKDNCAAGAIVHRFGKEIWKYRLAVFALVPTLCVERPRRAFPTGPRNSFSEESLGFLLEELESQLAVPAGRVRVVG